MPDFLRPTYRWGRVLFLTCLMWLMAWSLSFAQDGGSRPEITVDMPAEFENTGEPFDVRISVRNVGDEAALYGSITLSFPEGQNIAVRDASVLTVDSSECLLEGSHARVIDPSSGCEALQHNTACQVRVPIVQPIAELFHRGWAAGEQQSMTVRVFPEPGSSSVTIYARAAFRTPEDGCQLAIEPGDSTGNAIDQQSFPVYASFVNLVAPATEVVPPTETAIPPTETAIPPTETSIPPTETAIPPTAEPTAPPATGVPTDVPTNVPTGVPTEVPTEAPILPTATEPIVLEPSPTQANPIATTAPIEPTAIPPAVPTADDGIVTLLFDSLGSNVSYMILCSIFMILFLIFCALMWMLFRSRGSSNPPPPTPSQPFGPPSTPGSYQGGYTPPISQVPPSTPGSYQGGYTPPISQVPPSTPGSYQGGYTPPISQVPPPAEGPTRKWDNYTPPVSHTPSAGESGTRKWNDYTPPPTPPSVPLSSSRPMGSQSDIRRPSSPIETKLVISTPPIEPACLQCGTSQRLEASFCTTCGTARKTIGGRYAFLRELGKGGMGAVYLAQDQRIAGKQWAVKEMLDQLSTSPATQQKIREAFVQEAQLLATLEHPNLPRVIDFLNEEERYYLVMDFVEGETLETLLEMQQTPFTEQQVLSWVPQLCDVLTYLHQQQPPIIFRDLKPSNIMLTRTGRIQLIDFGIARIFKPDRDQDTIFMGTPGYAAPEQFSGSAQTDARTDVYALGVVLHNLLTKHPPETTMFTMPKVTQLNPAISPRMEAVIEQALQHDPAQRFGSMMAVKRALGLS